MRVKSHGICEIENKYDLRVTYRQDLEREKDDAANGDRDPCGVDSLRWLSKFSRTTLIII